MKPIDQAIDLFDQQYLSKGLGAQRRYPNEWLIQFLASRYFRFSEVDRKSIRVLEVGCGSGANLWVMAKEGFSTHGMDGSAKRLEPGAPASRGEVGRGSGVTRGLVYTTTL